MLGSRLSGGAGVEAEGFCVGYGNSQVLHALSFRFPPLRTSVILGPGGSGKTTLLHALGGRLYDRPRPWIRGTLMRPASSPAWLSQKLGNADRSLRGLLRDEVGQGSPEATLLEVWRDVPEAARTLAACLDAPLGSLPVAQSRLAELTVATAGRGWLLLDEPEADMEPHCRGWVERHLQGLRGKATLVVATHHLGLAQAVADHVLLLVDGRVVEAGEAERFFSRPAHPRTQHFVRMGS